MIALLRGFIEEKTAGRCVLSAGGVGYEVFIPVTTFYDLPDEGGEASLFIKTVVRDDAIELFGFLTKAEKQAFILLNGVSKIGPRLALAVLSGIGPAELVTAITGKNTARLTKIPGLGAKTAERIVLELKDKIQELAATAGAAPAEAVAEIPLDDLSRDAASALVNLGYAKAEAEKAVAKVRAEPGGEEADLSTLIRKCLKKLQKV